MSNIDTTTGMPQLPEGWFYRVSNWHLAGSRYTLMVEVRRRRRFLPSRFLGYSLAQATESSIRDAAGDALSDARSHVLDRSPFVGDYPPKKLGGAA